MFNFLKRGEDLIGFNPTRFLLVTSLVTGITFPIIFLGESIPSFLNNFALNTVFGFIYGATLSFGNCLIFQKSKERSIKDGTLRSPGRFFMVSLYHFFYTVIVSSILGSITMYGLDGSFQIGGLARHVVGAILFASLLITLFESFFNMYALNISKKKQEQLMRQNAESQLEILKSQVKPHFLFNSLNTVISIIPDEPNKAIDYIQRLSSVYRYILEIKDNKLIPIKEELDCIKDYVFMLQIRFGENLNFKLDETGLDSTSHVVPLSLQLLIENAVKHNIVSNKKPLTIKIEKGKEGYLEISNNLQIKTQKMPSTGTGLSNIKSRYELLTERKVEIIETSDNFAVSIPLLEVS